MLSSWLCAMHMWYIKSIHKIEGEVKWLLLLIDTNQPSLWFMFVLTQSVVMYYVLCVYVDSWTVHQCQ